MSIQLRKYQEVVVNNGFAMLREGMNAITFALPVASGKSVIFSSLARKRNDRVVFCLAPSWIHLNELKRNARKVFGSDVVFYRYGGSNDCLKDLPELEDGKQLKNSRRVFVFTTLFTAFHENRSRKFIRMLNNVNLVGHDETHMLARGRSFKKLKEICCKKNIPLVEMSGTPIEGCSDMVEGSPTFEELKKGKSVCPWKLIPVQTRENFDIQVDNNKKNVENWFH